MTMVTPVAGGVEDLTKAEELFDVNLNGAMNTLAPVAERRQTVLKHVNEMARIDEAERTPAASPNRSPDGRL